MIYIDTATYSPGPSLINLFRSTGVSEEATILQRQVGDAVTHLFDNESIGARLREGNRLLQEVADEHNQPNWDGYDALAVSEYSLVKAQYLLQTLPADIPLPDVEVDPDGEVSFDWYDDADGVFSVSIGDTGRLAFAGMFRQSKVHGVEYFYDEIPRPILFYLHQMLDIKQRS